MHRDTLHMMMVPVFASSFSPHLHVSAVWAQPPVGGGFQTRCARPLDCLRTRGRCDAWGGNGSMYPSTGHWDMRARECGRIAPAAREGIPQRRRRSFEFSALLPASPPRFPCAPFTPPPITQRTHLTRSPILCCCDVYACVFFFSACAHGFCSVLLGVVFLAPLALFSPPSACRVDRPLRPRRRTRPRRRRRRRPRRRARRRPLPRRPPLRRSLPLRRRRPRPPPPRRRPAPRKRSPRLKKQQQCLPA